MPENECAPRDHVQPETKREVDRAYWLGFAVVTALGIVSFSWSWLSTANARVWFDEAHTFVLVKDGYGRLFEFLQKDAHPPLYFVISAAFVKVFGGSGLALRLPSTLAAMAAVPLLFRFTYQVAGRRAAVIAGLLLACSPLLGHYAYEARGYSLVVLMMLLAMNAYLAVLQRERRPIAGRVLVLDAADLLLALALAGLCLTHNYGLLVLPAFVLHASLLARPDRGVLVGKVLAACVVAFLIDLPWFLVALRVEGGVTWLAEHWHGPVRWLAPLQSAWGFGPTPGYAQHLRHLWTAESNWILNAVVLGFVVVGLWLQVRSQAEGANEQSEPASIRPVALLCLLWLVPLSLAWSYSWFVRPIYLVGRYDLVALAPCMALFAIGSAKLQSLPKLTLLGTSMLVLWLGGSLYALQSAWMALDVQQHSRNLPEEAVLEMKKFAAPGDMVVTLGNHWTLLEYYRARHAVPVVLKSFPPSFQESPGWYDGEVFVREQNLQVEAQRLLDHLKESTIKGQTVWLHPNSCDEAQHVDPVFVDAFHRDFRQGRSLPTGTLVEAYRLNPWLPDK